MANTPVVVLALVAISAPAFADPSHLEVVDASTVDCHGFHEAWVPVGPDGTQLDSEDFYNDVGRKDLADAHARRRTYAIAGAVGAAAGLGATIYFAAQAAKTPSTMSCDPSNFQTFDQCVASHSAAFHAQESANQSNMMWSAGALLGTSAAMTVAIWYFTHPEPVSEADAVSLAASYNERHVSVAPYAGLDGGGVTLTGAF